MLATGVYNVSSQYRHGYVSVTHITGGYFGSNTSTIYINSFLYSEIQINMGSSIT